MRLNAKEARGITGVDSIIHHPCLAIPLPDRGENKNVRIDAVVQTVDQKSCPQ
jgi:hypothetical protein